MPVYDSDLLRLQVTYNLQLEWSLDDRKKGGVLANGYGSRAYVSYDGRNMNAAVRIGSGDVVPVANVGALERYLLEEDFARVIIHDDQIIAFAVKYKLKSKLITKVGCSLTNEWNDELVLIYNTPVSKVNWVYGTDVSTRFIDLNELEQYLLRKEFIWAMIDDDSLRDLASRYGLTLSVVEKGQCSLTNSEGKEASLLYNESGANLALGTDGFRRFVHIKKLERHLIDRGFLPQPVDHNHSGGGSFKSELYTPRPSWLHLGHELQSIERRIDRLLLC
jgi:hypothetical protein